MKINIIGRKITVTDKIKDYTEKKLGKLDKFFKDETEARVVIGTIKDNEYAEVSIYASGVIFRAEVVEVDVVGLAVVGVFNEYLVDGAHTIVEYVEFHVVLSVDREFFADFDVCDFDVGLSLLAIVATCNNSLDAKFAFVAIAAHFGEELPFVVFGAIVVDVHTHAFRVELEFATFHAEHSAIGHADVADVDTSERVV